MIQYYREWSNEICLRARIARLQLATFMRRYFFPCDLNMKNARTNAPAIVRNEQFSDVRSPATASLQSSVEDRHIKWIINILAFSSALFFFFTDRLFVPRPLHGSAVQRFRRKKVQKKVRNEYGPSNRIMMNAHIPMGVVRDRRCIYHPHRMLTFTPLTSIHAHTYTYTHTRVVFIPFDGLAGSVSTRILEITGVRRAVLSMLRELAV